MPPSLSPGWHVSDHALHELLDDTPEDAKKLETRIVNFDLKLFGLPSLQDKMDKNAGLLKGPIVMQITRIRDCGRPSIGESSSSSNILRVFLTDGHQTVSGLAFEKISGLSEDKTPWGTKILLKGDVRVEGQFIILTPSNVVVIGGRVERLIERWSIEKNSMKGIGRKSGEDAPKWISYGKRDNNAYSIKNTKNFKVNDVIKGATEKGEGGGEDTFEKTRKEKLEAVEAAERKFAKVKVPKGGLSEEAKIEQMKEKMKKRGEKEEEGREKRGMKGRRKGRKYSDDEADIPSEFARPSQGITLSSFLGEGIAPTIPSPTVTLPPQPPITNGRERGGGGRGRNNYGRGGYGREDRRIDGYGQRNEDRSEGGHGNRVDRGRRSINGRGRGASNVRGGSQSMRDGGYGKDDCRPLPENQGGYGNGRGRNRGFTGHDLRNSEDGRRGGRGGFSSGAGGGNGMNRGRIQKGEEKIPPLMSDIDFPSVDGLNRGMEGMKIRGGMNSNHGKGREKEGIKSGTKVKAPWDDGNFYPATVLSIVAGTMATVRFDGHDHFKTLPLGVLLQ